MRLVHVGVKKVKNVLVTKKKVHVPVVVKRENALVMKTAHVDAKITIPGAIAQNKKIRKQARDSLFFY